MKPPLPKIGINAVSAKSGGAATTLVHWMRDLPQRAPQFQFFFFGPEAAVKYRSPWRRLFWDQVALRRAVKREGLDLLISSSDFGMLFPPCRQILMIRNPLFFSPLYLKEILPKKSLRFRLDFLLRRRLIALSALFSERVLVASASMLADVRRFMPLSDSKASVNPFGAPLGKFQPKPGSPATGPFRMLCVSEYGDYKNFTVLLKAVLRLESLGVKDIRLRLTADPGQFPEAEISTRTADRALAGDPKISPLVTFAGASPYDQIERLYQESDLFVFPSMAESFGHPLVEAMASGLPVLASDIPLCREICGEAALYFDPLDPKDLAQKILALKKDLGLRERLGALGRNRVRDRFNWDHHVGRLIQNFEEALTFSYGAERGYYARNWPRQAPLPRHLESYLRCWMDPRAVFQDKRVLDIGAGECGYSRTLAERFRPKRVVACDLFRERLLPASRVNQNPALRFVTGDCFRLPFRNGSFDVVFGSFVLHQLPGLPKIFPEIRRVLSDSGCYVGIEPNPLHPVHLARYYLGRHSPNQYLLSPRHLQDFSRTGFQWKVRYFYARLPWIRSRLLGTCMGITAVRSDGN